MRNYNLDFLKIIACIAVIGIHTFSPHAIFLYYFCNFAVPVFFMCSGYIISGRTYVYEGGTASIKLVLFLGLLLFGIYYDGLYPFV